MTINNKTTLGKGAFPSPSETLIEDINRVFDSLKFCLGKDGRLIFPSPSRKHAGSKEVAQQEFHIQPAMLSNWKKARTRKIQEQIKTSELLLKFSEVKVRQSDVRDDIIKYLKDNHFDDLKVIKRGLEGYLLELRSLHRAGAYMSKKLSVAYTRSFDVIGRAIDPGLPLAPSSSTNPKPLRIKNVEIDKIYLISGNMVDSLDISVRYHNEYIELPDDIKHLYNPIIEAAESRARSEGHKFFNGTTVRLLGINQSTSYQNDFGIEKTRVILDMGPLMWFDYVVLNENLDNTNYRDAKGSTIRTRYAQESSLYEHGQDISWCRLSNIMPICIVPITSDGYGFLQIRSSSGVSSTAGRLTAGVTENIQRFADEADQSNLCLRVNELGSTAKTPIPPRYVPQGIPSPLLAAERGIYEEISPKLEGYFLPNQIKFLSLVWDLEFFAPVLCGVVELPLTREELTNMMTEHYASDHTENLRALSLYLSTDDHLTVQTLQNAEQWDLGGLAAAISALRYWEAREGRIERGRRKT